MVSFCFFLFEGTGHLNPVSGQQYGTQDKGCSPEYGIPSRFAAATLARPGSVQYGGRYGVCQLLKY